MTRPSLLPAFLAAMMFAYVLWRLESVWTMTSGLRDRAANLLVLLFAVAR